MRRLAGLLLVAALIACSRPDPNSAVCGVRLSTTEDKRRALSEQIDLGAVEGRIGWFQDDYAVSLLDASDGASPAVVAVVQRSFDLRKAVLLEQLTRAGQGASAQREMAAIATAVDNADDELAALCG